MRNILLLVALAGCSVKSDFVRTRAAPVGAPRAAHTVEVFILERPARPYVEVGFVEVRASDSSVSAGDLMAELRERAGKEGCNAVAFLGDNDHFETRSSSSSDSTSVTSESHDGYRAVCLVYTVPRAAHAR